MPLASENTSNYNSPIVVGCAGSKLPTITWRGAVAAVPSGERNFHIFYYLVAGASSEERQHLHLQEKVQDRYLGQRSSGARPNSVRDDDTHQFEQLKVALKMAGLSKRHVAQTCQLITVILHLGNLEFTIGFCDVDAAVVRNTV